MSDNPDKKSRTSLPKGKHKICRPWITVHGKRVYARERGLKAFCFYVDDEK